MRLFEIHPKLKCPQIWPDRVLTLEAGRLNFDGKAMMQEFQLPLNRISCSTRCIKKSSEDITEVIFDDWQLISDLSTTTNISCDIVHLRCNKRHSLFPSQLFETLMYQIVPIQKYNANSASTGSPPNVVLLIIDSMSRNHFIRALPKTYNYLINNYGALDFKGAVKVGLNSFPNVMAMLTGEKYDSVEATCDTDKIDEHNFSKRGYATLYGESMKSQIFQTYGVGGFRQQPTDHYMRPLLLANKQLSMFRQSGEYCFGNVPYHKLYTDTILKMFKAYPTAQPKFIHLHFEEITHEEADAVTSADDDLREFLVSFQSIGGLSNTFFFFIADHGLRFGPIHETVQGHIEDRMPFLTLTTPEWFRKKYPSLQQYGVQNTDGRLVTTFDTHATLKFILDRLWEASTTTKTEGKYYQDVTIGNFSTEHGLPFFSAIPKNRSCQQASIPAIFCPCENGVTIPNNESRVLSAADAIIDHLNSFLSSRHRNKCAILSLSAIRNAQVILPNHNILFYQSGNAMKLRKFQDMVLQYKLIFTVMPSKALFSATVDHSLRYNKFTVIGHVERNNRYGKQSTCVREDRISVTYCYCL